VIDCGASHLRPRGTDHPRCTDGGRRYSANFHHRTHSIQMRPEPSWCARVCHFHRNVVSGDMTFERVAKTWEFGHETAGSVSEHFSGSFPLLFECFHETRAVSHLMDHKGHVGHFKSVTPDHRVAGSSGVGCNSQEIRHLTFFRKPKIEWFISIIISLNSG
jgi:hypothetical protein